jgi:hypothetical protein
MLDLLVQVSAELAARGIAHAMIGAGALAVHGIVRSTFDLDLFSTDGGALARATWAILESRGVVVDVRVGDEADPLAGVVRLAAAGQRTVDVIVGRHPWQAAVARRASPTPIGGAAVPVAAPADLILLKLYAGGPQDAWDVQQLLAAAPDAAALVEEVERGLSNLPADAVELWRRITTARP